MLRKKFKNEKGQAMVEFALVLPILLLLICGIIDFGWLFFNQYTVDNAARQGSRTACVNATLPDREEIIEQSVEDALQIDYSSSLEVTAVYSNPSNLTAGDVTVTVKAKMKILTPVLGVIYKNQEKVVSSSVTMKVES